MEKETESLMDGRFEEWVRFGWGTFVSLIFLLFAELLGDLARLVLPGRHEDSLFRLGLSVILYCMCLAVLAVGIYGVIRTAYHFLKPPIMRWKNR